MVVSFLSTLLRNDSRGNNDQVQHSTAMAWNIIAQELDFDLNGGKVWQHLLTFTETEGVHLINFKISNGRQKIK